MVSPSSFPDFLGWIPEVEKTIDYQRKTQEAEAWVQQSDLILLVDHNAPDRSGDLESLIASSKATKIMIDHHPKPTYPVDYQLSCTEVSSTAELVYGLLSEIEASAIDSEVATAIYVGIMTDTGNFVHNVHPDTFRIVSELIALGIDRDAIFDKVFNNFSFDRMRLMGYALHQKTMFLEDLGVAIMALSKKELEEYHFITGDTEGFVNLPLAIKGVKASILVLEKEEEIRFSFRSKGDIHINQIAKNYYDGGGHKNAAGGSDKSGIGIEEAVIKLKEVLNKERKLFNK